MVDLTRVRRNVLGAVPWALAFGIITFGAISDVPRPILYGVGALAVASAAIVEREIRRQPGADVVACSFCKKSRVQVPMLVAGPDGVAICDACIRTSSELLDAHEAGPSPAQPIAPPPGPPDPWRPPEG